MKITNTKSEFFVKNGKKSHNLRITIKNNNKKKQYKN